MFTLLAIIKGTQKELQHQNGMTKTLATKFWE